MASWWARRRKTVRSPARRRLSQFLRVPRIAHGAAGLAAAVLTLAHAGVSRAAFDMTGDWYFSAGFGFAVPVHITQTGTSLYFTVSGNGFTGTIDPNTGAFNFQTPFMGSYDCGGMFDGQLALDGNTFTAPGSIAVTPPDCYSIDCACSGVQAAEVVGSRSPCGNQVVDGGEVCDDGQLGFGGSCCALGCIPQPAGQDCRDDNDLCTDDVCDAMATCTHPPEPDGTSCNDGRFCNGEETVCQSGVCQGFPPPCPLACDESTDRCVTACPSAPSSCRAAARSVLLVKSGGEPARNRVMWKWIRGATTSQTEFGDPTQTADYALCIYAGTPATLAADAIIPGGTDAWSSLGATGYKYDDPTAAIDGITRILLKGRTQDRSKVLVKGKGAELPLFPLPFTAPVTVQLVNGDSGMCWGAGYTPEQVRKNAMGRFRAKAP